MCNGSNGLCSHGRNVHSGRKNVHNEGTPNLHFEIFLYKAAPLVHAFRAIPYGGCVGFLVSHEASFRKVEDSCLLCGFCFYIGCYMEVRACSAYKFFL